MADEENPEDIFSFIADLNFDEEPEKQEETAAQIASYHKIAPLTPSTIDFILNRHPALIISIPGESPLLEPKKLAASTGWVIVDFGNYIAVGPGDHAYDRDFLTEPARITAHEAVHYAQKKEKPEIVIVPEKFGIPEEAPRATLSRKMQVFAWEETTRLGLKCDFQPTAEELKHQSYVEKVFGRPRPSEGTTPT